MSPPQRCGGPPPPCTIAAGSQCPPGPFPPSRNLPRLRFSLSKMGLLLRVAAQHDEFTPREHAGPCLVCSEFKVSPAVLSSPRPPVTPLPCDSTCPLADFLRTPPPPPRREAPEAPPGIYMCSTSCRSVAQLYTILCNPMDCSLPGSSVHGILQARILERVAISFSRGSSWTRDRTCISCTGRQSLYH